MSWTELLTGEMETAYPVADGLIGLVDERGLDWKPATGANWMTMGQLLMHIATACGQPCKGLLTGDWGLPEGVRMEDLPAEAMLPPAETLPAVESLDHARRLLAEDRALALQMVAAAGETELAGRMMTVPWSPQDAQVLGLHMLHMIDHLNSHKAQLFYYLKLQGKPVGTEQLWGP